ERNADQAELQQARPTGPAIRCHAREGQRVGGVGRECIVHGKVSKKLHSYGRGISPRWRSPTVEPVSRGRHDTSRQFQRKNPGFLRVGTFTEIGRNLSKIALRSREIRGSVCWAVPDTAKFRPTGESSMVPNLATEIAALPRLRVSELRAKFAEVFGEA